MTTVRVPVMPLAGRFMPASRVPQAEGAYDILRAYLAAIRRVPMLTASEERALCLEIDAARRALEKAQRPRTRGAAAERYAALLHERREQLVVANLRLVAAAARKYRHAGLPLEDLIQEGNMGLMKAADRFDPHRGVRFSTYAMWWIRQSMLAAIGTTARTIRLPANVLGALREIDAVRTAFVREQGRMPRPAEIAARTGVAPSRVEELLGAADRPLPLGEPLAGGILLQDILPDRVTPTPETHVSEADERRALAAAIETLDARERRVLEMRFGLRSGREHTLEDIARHLGITRKRVRQLEDRALRRLRLRTGRQRRAA